MDGVLEMQRTQRVSIQQQQHDGNPLVFAEWTQTWDGHLSTLNTIADSQRNYFVFSEDCASDVSCPAVMDLSHPKCAGDSCTPCFAGAY